MLVGLWGAICMFQVSRDKIYTFRDAKISTEGRWAEHEIITELPRAEYLGPGLTTVSMTVDLIVEQGVKPRKIVDSLREHCKLGTTSLLIIGTERLSDHSWCLKSIEESWDRIIGPGKLGKATVDLTFREAP